jgi:hypothetical protein
MCGAYCHHVLCRTTTGSIAGVAVAAGAAVDPGGC